MGPFTVFFAGHLAFAWRESRPRSRRIVRWLLGGVAVLIPAFWTLVFISQEPDGAGWASALLYLSLGYLLYVSLRFALEPTSAEPTSTGDAPGATARGARLGLDGSQRSARR